MQFSGIKHIHSAVQQSPPSISRMLFILQNGDSVPVKQ